ncbi:MAG: hypothetical protein M3Q39_15970 [Actinomycetota bacterium]|nr:hypothetical protein [Actinomycetota bacterium]
MNVSPRTPAEIMRDVKAQHAVKQAGVAELELPPPEVYARRPEGMHEIPSSARRFLKINAKRRKVTVARGPVIRTEKLPDAGEKERKTRDVIAMVDSVMFKVQVGERIAALVWIENSYAYGYGHGVGRIKANQAYIYLTREQIEPDLEWFEGSPRLTLSG